MCSLQAINDIYLRKLNLLINLVIFNVLTRHHDLSPINVISSIKMVKILNSVFFLVEFIRVKRNCNYRINDFKI